VVLPTDSLAGCPPVSGRFGRSVSSLPWLQGLVAPSFLWFRRALPSSSASRRSLVRPPVVAALLVLVSHGCHCALGVDFALSSPLCGSPYSGARGRVGFARVCCRFLRGLARAFGSLRSGWPRSVSPWVDAIALSGLPRYVAPCSSVSFCSSCCVVPGVVPLSRSLCGGCLAVPFVPGSRCLLASWCVLAACDWVAWFTGRSC